jgi:hypothetical protein
MPAHYRNATRVVLGLAWSLYAFACLLPAVVINDSIVGHGPPLGGVPGWFLLFPGGMVVTALFGPVGMMPVAWAWLANPLFATGTVLLLMRRSRAAFRVAAAGLLLSAGCWLPNSVPMSGMLVGYYLWVGALVVLAAGSYVLARAVPGQIDQPTRS